jgi:hypothetical protein
MTNEEAIKELKDASYSEARYGDKDNHRDEVMKRIEAFDMAIQVLVQTKWIPVSERLPEKNGKYLVTVRNGNVYAGVYDAFSGRFQCAAIAWMPLPEPYRSESE